MYSFNLVHILYVRAGELEPEPESLGKKSQEPEPVEISRLLSPARR